MPVRRVFQFAITLAALVLFVAPVAAKPNKTAARESYQRGIEHYNLSEFSAALDAFKEAYRNYPDPTFLFNIGQCQRQLGDRAGAILSYKAYLRESPSAPNRTEVQSMIAALENAVREDERLKQRPPEGAMPPPGEGTAATTPPTTGEAQKPSAPAAAVSATPEGESPRQPLYKKWWLWTAVGVVVAGGVATGLAVGLTRSPSYPSATTTNGTVSF